jgi:hypothetical protein
MIMLEQFNDTYPDFLKLEGKSVVLFFISFPNVEPKTENLCKN